MRVCTAVVAAFTPGRGGSAPRAVILRLRVQPVSKDIGHAKPSFQGRRKSPFGPARPGEVSAPAGGTQIRSFFGSRPGHTENCIGSSSSKNAHLAPPSVGIDDSPTVGGRPRPSTTRGAPRGGFAAAPGRRSANQNSDSRIPGMQRPAAPGVRPGPPRRRSRMRGRSRRHLAGQRG